MQRNASPEELMCVNYNGLVRCVQAEKEVSTGGVWEKNLTVSGRFIWKT
jgi:hypothetical protein